MKVYTDASHGIHEDGKGHGGIVIMIGTGYVFAKSGKIKTVTLSSTESEGYMMCDAATYIVWMRELLSYFSYDMSVPTRMMQDNLSAIWLATHEGAFGRNKHTLIKRAFVKEKVEDGVVAMVHCDTERMVADMGTKPLCKKLLYKHMMKIGMVNCDNKQYSV